ncbi:ferrochelatase [Synechococcus phage ACG-2014g]|jgi:hypothetical protein|uniref:Fe2OG dioxygenase domain-containing protein n=1 Tax=Synechococcus phage ACG-2014g TaxID=1493512 RepID=A0A0E3FDN5_9CAUD|nr:ferrochelatase [Synechococcus phage ACG-2014g]AIX24494.1 hypothetical protein Syn7803US105_150 [Synechococcus phage ACG-2014g]
MNFLDYVSLYDIEDDAFCDSVVSEYSTWEWETHQWGHEYDSECHYEDDSAENLFPVKESNLLYNICDTVFSDYSRKFEIGLVNFAVPKYARYNTGSFLRVHYDHAKDLFDGKERGIPICTLVGLLNDDFEGGDFYLRNEDMELEKGHILIFPSIFLYPHEVKKVTKGVRNSFVSWAW